MDEKFLQELEAGIIERLSYVLLESKEYKRALAEEKTAYEKLVTELTEGQQEKLEEYYDAISISTILIEKMAYKQGAADLANLLMTRNEQNTLI